MLVWFWWSLFQVPVNQRLRWLLFVLELGPRFQSPWRSLDIPRGHSGFWRSFGPAPMEVTCLGLLPWVAPSYLLLHMSLAWAWSKGGCWLRLAPSEVAPSFGGLWLGPAPAGVHLGPAPAEVTGPGLLLRRLLSQACSNTFFLKCPIHITVCHENCQYSKWTGGWIYSATVKVLYSNMLNPILPRMHLSLMELVYSQT